MKKIKIYFLLHSKAFWPSWKSFWYACKLDSKIETKVIFCPVTKTEKGRDGQFVDTEKWLKENNIDYIHINNINILFDRPDVMFLQLPYDGYRTEAYKSSRLKQYLINLSYISYGLEFTEAPYNIKNHFKLPCFSNSWRIYTFNKSLVKDFWKYCPKGSKHVKCLGHPKFDALYEAQKVKMPEWLKEKIGGRKVICWHPHFPCDYSTKKGKPIISTFPWQENLKILDYIKKDEENFYIFMAHHMFFGTFEHKYNIPHDDIEIFKEQLSVSTNSIIWEGEYPEILAWSDVFLGERSAVTMEMITTNKPVIYLENCPEVYNQFGKDVIKSYYYASNADTALDFLEKIKIGQDEKSEKRQKTFEKYILPYWDGQCGERIKNDIICSRKELQISFFDLIKAYLITFVKEISNNILSYQIVRRVSAKHLVIKILGIKLKIRLKAEKIADRGVELID